MFLTPPAEFADGEPLFEQGDPSDLCFLVERGEVDVVVASGQNGHPVRLSTLGPGELVGEMSLVDERPRVATARAVGTTTVQPFTRGEFEDLILNRPAASLRLIRALFERLRMMNARVERLVSSPGVEQAPSVRLDAERARLHASLTALTPQGRELVPKEGLEIRRFPLRIGRAEGGTLDLNELLLNDVKPYQISRNHCSIERDGGRLVVRDRGSYLGTLVNGHRIGGKRSEGTAPLATGDNEIILGREASPWRFRITVTDPGA